MITSQEVRVSVARTDLDDSPIRCRITLERCPPELIRGIWWTAGWCWRVAARCLRGFDKLLSEETGCPVHVAEDPLSAVAEGTGKCLNELKFCVQVASSDRTWR